MMDAGTIVVASITLILFAVALFEKGITHDMLLEAGVFLVSVKLLMMAYKTHRAEERVTEKLDAIMAALRQGKAGS